MTMLPYTTEQVSAYMSAASGIDSTLAHYTGFAGYNASICDYNTFFSAIAVIVGTKSVDTDALAATIDAAIIAAIRDDMASFLA